MSILRKNGINSESVLRENSVVILLLILYVSFCHFWEDIISQHVVETFLCHFESSWTNDTLFFIAVIVCFVLFVFNRRKCFSFKTIILCFILLLLWFYYRFISDHFGFISLHLFSSPPSDSNTIKYVDIIALYAGSIIFTSFFVFFIPRKIVFSEDAGFIRDAPYTNDPTFQINEDILDRRWLAYRNVSKLLETNTSNGAFTFGIDAPWGAGKTSFMNMMKDQIILSCYSQIPIMIDFNPWLYSTQNDLVFTFMDELSKHLKRYDQSLAKNLIDYSKLLSSFDTTETKLVASLVNMSHAEGSLQEMKEQIANSIKRINLLVFVFIDDLDRLDADELMEMMKLIRNISDFPYMYFIAAYDKTYLVKCLEGKMKAKGVYFVEKIFQHEFHLPSSPINTLRKMLLYYIYEYAYSPGSYLENFIINDIDTNNPLNGLSNLREVKRLANHFTSSVSSFSPKELDNMNEVDILLFELFKTKYPLVLTFFERKIDEILVLDDEMIHYRLFRGANDNNHFDFLKYIHSHYEEFNINEIDERSIIIILERLFDPIYPSDLEYQHRHKLNDIEWFNRFIRFSESDFDINDKVFDAVIKLEFHEVQKRIDQWSIGMSHAFIHHVTKHTSRDKEEQKVLVKSIFYFMSKGNKIELSEIDKVLSKLKTFNQTRNFTSDDKAFMQSILTENGYNNSICGFIFHLLQETNLVDVPLSNSELAHIQQDLFNEYIAETNNIHNILWEFCVLLGIENQSDEYKIKCSDEYVVLLAESMQEIANKHLNEMISIIIVGNNRNEYKLSPMTETIWGSMNDFCNYIQVHNDNDPIIQEFKEFIKVFKNNNYKAVQFSFEQIKLSR